MIMDTFKHIFLWVLYIISLTGCVCSSNTMTAKLVYAEDDKCYEDSIYNIVRKSNKNARHGRKIELRYKIQNNTQEDFFFPLRSVGHENFNSHLEVNIITNNDTIVPVYTIDRSPSDSIYIRQGITEYIILRIHDFDCWQRNGCTTATTLEKILKMLNITYLPSEKDRQNGEQYDFPELEISSKFVDVTTFCKESGKRYEE